MRIEVKILKEGAVLPTRGTSMAAGYDLRACLDEPVTIAPHTTVRIGTGEDYVKGLITFFKNRA